MKLFGGKKDGKKDGENGFFASVAGAFNSAADSFSVAFERKWVRVLVVALAVTGVLAIGVATAYKMLFTLPEIPIDDPTQIETLPTFDMNEPVVPPPTTSPDSQEVTGRKDGCYTMLLAGVQGNGDLNTDTLMVGMLDTVNKELNIISIPRDTMVNVKRTVKKINSAYAMGCRDSKETGALQLMTEIKSIIGFMPDYYAIVNMDGFVKLVNAMGGVTYNVPQNMYKDTGDMIINLKKGTKTLNGNEALQLVRFRGYAGKDDYGRMETQQGFIKAMAKQLVSLGNLFKINEFIAIAQENLQTNLEVTDMTAFGQQLLTFSGDKIMFHTLPSTPGYLNDTAYVFVNEAETVELVNKTINPFTHDITDHDLDILTMKS